MTAVIDNDDAMRIRPCHVETDLDALYDICLRTGAAGSDASDLMTDPRLLGEVFAAPYALLETAHAFVLDDGSGRPVGYVLGARDVVDFEQRAEAEWWPALRQRYPEAQGMGWGRRMIDHLFASLRDAGSIGVHLGASTANTDAIAFYRHLGFTELGSDAATVRFARSLDPTRS